MTNYIDLGDLCVYCGDTTEFGSGKFVNRISAYVDVNSVPESVKAQYPDAVFFEGYACSVCTAYTCDGCGEEVMLDYEYRVGDDYYHLGCVPDEASLRQYADEYDLSPNEYNDLRAEWLETQEGEN